MSNPDYTDADGTHYTWLRATGYVQTLAVDDLRPGDVLAYNHAGAGVVVDVRRASRCFVVITTAEGGRVFQSRSKLGTRRAYWRRDEVVPTLSGPIPGDAPRRSRELDLRVVDLEAIRAKDALKVRVDVKDALRGARKVMLAAGGIMSTMERRASRRTP